MDCNCLNTGKCFDLNSNNETSLLCCQLPAMDMSLHTLSCSTGLAWTEVKLRAVSIPEQTGLVCMVMGRTSPVRQSSPPLGRLWGHTCTWWTSDAVNGSLCGTWLWAAHFTDGETNFSACHWHPPIPVQKACHPTAVFVMLD